MCSAHGVIAENALSTHIKLLGENVAKKKNKRKSTNKDYLTTFRRKMHSGAELRAGLSYARQNISEHQVAPILSHLASNKLYQSTCVPNAFPADFPDVRKSLSLAPVSPGVEFLWSSLVAGMFAKQLSGYVVLRDDFYGAMILDDYERAEIILDRVKAEYGVSCWYVESKIQLIHKKYGLKSQKEYVEKIAEEDGAPWWAAIVGFYYSVRAEDNVTTDSLLEEMHDIISHPNVGQVFSYYLFPFQIENIKSTSKVLSLSEVMPVIDRYNALIDMLCIEYARKQAGANLDIPQILKCLDGIEDHRLDNIRSLEFNDYSQADAGAQLLAYDKYTCGHYEAVINDFILNNKITESGARSIELLARCICNVAISPKIEGGLAEIIYCMRDVILTTEHYAASRSRLLDFALKLGRNPLALQIEAFLRRDHDYAVSVSYSEIDRLYAVGSSLYNPWHMHLLTDISDDEKRIEQYLLKFPLSKSLKLWAIICSPKNHTVDDIERLGLPSCRSQYYQGHLFALQSDFQSALSAYEKAHGGSRLTENLANQRSFEIMFNLGEIHWCVSRLASQLIRNPATYRIYPLAEVVEEALRLDDDFGLDLCILLHFSSRFLDVERERDLSDIVDNYLFDQGVDWPSELVCKETWSNIEIEKRNFFLRYICITRVLDSLPAGQSVRDVEADRIKICQFLIEDDPANESVYAKEIKDLTRDGQVEELLTAVNQSKIYVDMDAIKSSLEADVSMIYERYVSLLSIPDIGYSSEKFARFLEEMTGQKLLGNENMDLFHSSERETLFEKLYSILVNEFALNPAYGLDTHLSTSIRHGAFEGHLRSPLAMKGLLTGDESEQKFLDVVGRFLPSSDLNLKKNKLKDAVARFSSVFNREVNIWKDVYLRVREQDQNKEGKIIVSYEVDKYEALRREVNPSLSYNKFVELVSKDFWGYVDQSLDNIRRDLDMDFRRKINNAFKYLLDSIDKILDGDDRSLFNANVLMGQTEFNSSLSSVIEWFRRSGEQVKEAFSLDLAFDVAAKQVENCYKYKARDVVLSNQIRNKVTGEYFNCFVELFFILLQNGLVHGAVSDEKTVMVSLQEDGGWVTVETRNLIGEKVDLQQSLKSAELANKCFKINTLEDSRNEGGSGFPKIKRILEFEMGVSYEAHVQLVEREFCVTLKFNAEQVFYESSSD